MGPRHDITARYETGAMEGEWRGVDANHLGAAAGRVVRGTACRTRMSSVALQVPWWRWQIRAKLNGLVDRYRSHVLILGTRQANSLNLYPNLTFIQTGTFQIVKNISCKLVLLKVHVRKQA